MKNYAIIFFIFNCSLGLSQQLDIQGNQNIRDFKEVIPEIKESIHEDFKNLNMYEYSYALPELLAILEIESNRERWLTYLKNMQTKINDTTKNEYFSSTDPFVLKLQSSFFCKTLHLLDSNQITSSFQKEFDFLVESLNDLSVKYDFSLNEIKTNIKISDQRGKTNFWYLFQVFDCEFLKQVVFEDEKIEEYFYMNIDGYEIISTYKIPYRLQKLKWKEIQYRLAENNSCKNISEIMNNREIGIFDNDKTFYSSGLKEGIDRLKEREF